jgi:hypothetical protein
MKNKRQPANFVLVATNNIYAEEGLRSTGALWYLPAAN